MLFTFLNLNKAVRIIGALFLFNFLFLSGSPSASSSQKRPFLWNTGRIPSHFTGREEIIEKVKNYFKTNTRGVLALTGISGIDKTQIAKAYAHLHHDSYDIIWWSDSRQDLEPQFHQLAVEWNSFFPNSKEYIPLDKLALKALPHYIKNKLRLTNHSWLLIFDDVPNKKIISAYFPEIHLKDSKRKNILITSQDQNGWEKNYIIKTFTLAEALKYIQASLAGTAIANAKCLVDTTTLHPFYLAKAVDYIYTNAIPIDIYLKTYKERQKSMTIKNKSLSSMIAHKNDEDSLLLAIADLSTKHPEAYQLLEFLSIFKEEHIPHFMLETFLNKSQIHEDLFPLLKILRKYSFLEETQKIFARSGSRSQ